MSETVTGYIDHVIFRNEDNGYTVMVLKGMEEGQELTCVGTFPAITQGVSIEASGNYTTHPVYGKQFQISSYVEKMPEDALAVERYLGSGAIKGIGAALAARIVRRFGDDTMRIVEEEPERLAEIKGISEKKAMEIAEQMTEKADMRRAMIFLQKYGISLNLGAKIYQKYGQSVYGVLQENPYRLAEDISGVGFRIADEIARKSGFAMDSAPRIRAGILYVLNAGTKEGYVYMPEKLLLQEAVYQLGVSMDQLMDSLEELVYDKSVIVTEERDVYLPSLYYSEMNCARMLFDLNVPVERPTKALDELISRVEKSQEIVLDDQQKIAVREALTSGFLVITGGPGTGKTTTINTLIACLMEKGLSILLAAPTGRAAKRMAEATGQEAQTIHRLLEYNGAAAEQENVSEERSDLFGRNEWNPLETDVVIIDEMSMVDIFLFQSLLKAVPVGTRLILVGDASQLPSVGPGQVLRDLINVHTFPTVMLQKIFRQAEESDIVMNAHRINRGEHLTLNNKSKDFFFLERKDVPVIYKHMVQLISEKLPRYVNAGPYDIQVLTPMRKGALGVETLNQILQQYLNPPAPEKKEYLSGSCLFREGDKVMQIRNNYQLEWEILSRYQIPIDKGTGVFNGDMGVIKEINEYAQAIIVEFDEMRRVTYPYSLLDELELAYATTIHKAQGSEYPAVVMPLLNGPKMLFNRNLLYTGVTRARNCVTILGSSAVLQEMIDNVSESTRYTSLDDRIREFIM